MRSFIRRMPAAEPPGGQILDTRAGRRGKNVKNRILVIEDEASISELICMNLEIGGYEARPLYTGREVLELLGAEGGAAGDLALVDVMLPDRDGFELMGALTARGIPVIYLTARGDLASKVRGLTLGAEDYIVKPFEMLELMVRMEKVLERTGRARRVLTFRELSVDLDRHIVRENGREVPLKPMEFALLSVFLKNRNRILSRDRLLDMVWGTDFAGETRTVDVHVANLRRKLAACRAIRTIPKAGYLFEDDEVCG